MRAPDLRRQLTTIVARTEPDQEERATALASKYVIKLRTPPPAAQTKAHVESEPRVGSKWLLQWALETTFLQCSLKERCRSRELQAGDSCLRVNLLKVSEKADIRPSIAATRQVRTTLHEELKLNRS